MSLPKSLTTVTTFSKTIAVFVFMLLFLVGIRFGMSYQMSLCLISDDLQKAAEKNKNLLPIPTLKPIPSASKIDWYRYMSKTLDYYIDYPKNYWYGSNSDVAVSFEKEANYPHRTNYWIFIEKGVSPQFSQAKIDELKQMKVGEKKVIMKKESSLPSQFKTYERLPDAFFGNKKAIAFVNKDNWEAEMGTYLYTYIYEGRNTYIFGGATNESNKSKDNITYSEFKEIISTLTFLD